MYTPQEHQFDETGTCFIMFNDKTGAYFIILLLKQVPVLSETLAEHIVDAETDYLLQINTNIIPIEVKAGKAGTRKSLHQLILEKGSTLAIRFDMQRPMSHAVDFNVGTRENTHNVKFQLLSLPIYMVGECKRLAEMCFT